MIRISAKSVTERPCEQCQRLFVPMKGSAGRFCSRQCSGVYRTAHKERFPCAHCGKTIEHQIVRTMGFKNYFCDRKCHNDFRRGPRGTVEERFWRYVAKSDGCWIWTAVCDKKGYGRMTVRRDGRTRNPIASRISWELHYGPIPDGLSVLHRCDNPPCVRPDHLFLGTRLDNAQDCVRKGRKPVGEQCSFAKLTEEQVIEIRHRFSSGERNRNLLAKRFGVSRQVVCEIINRKLWKHLL